jgi:hypothetical protein
MMVDGGIAAEELETNELEAEELFIVKVDVCVAA